jgi:hypothetical protein
MPSSGQLRDRVTFQRRGTIDDGYGNEVSGPWTDVFSVAANIRPAVNIFLLPVGELLLPFGSREAAPSSLSDGQMISLAASQTARIKFDAVFVLFLRNLQSHRQQWRLADFLRR